MPLIWKRMQKLSPDRQLKNELTRQLNESLWLNDICAEEEIVNHLQVECKIYIVNYYTNDSLWNCIFISITPCNDLWVDNSDNMAKSFPFKMWITFQYNRLLATCGFRYQFRYFPSSPFFFLANCLAVVTTLHAHISLHIFRVPHPAFKWMKAKGFCQSPKSNSKTF